MSTSSTAKLDSAVIQESVAFVPPTKALSLSDSFQQQVQDSGKSEFTNNPSALKQLLTSNSATAKINKLDLSI